MATELEKELELAEHCQCVAREKLRAHIRDLEAQLTALWTGSEVWPQQLRFRGVFITWYVGWGQRKRPGLPGPYRILLSDFQPPTCPGPGHRLQALASAEHGLQRKALPLLEQLVAAVQEKATE
jgi:hypothetical protein